MAAEDHQHGSELSETQLRVRALETVLTEKGYIDPAALDLIIEAYETKVGPHNGARVIARAWHDPASKRALLEDGFFSDALDESLEDHRAVGHPAQRTVGHGEVVVDQVEFGDTGSPVEIGARRTLRGGWRET